MATHLLAELHGTITDTTDWDQLHGTELRITIEVQLPLRTPIETWGPELEQLKEQLATSTGHDIRWAGTTGAYTLG